MVGQISIQKAMATGRTTIQNEIKFLQLRWMMEKVFDFNQNVIIPILKLDQQTLKSHISLLGNDLDQLAHQEQWNLVPLGKFRIALAKEIKADV